MKSCAVMLTHEVGRGLVEAECGCGETALCDNEAAASRWHALHLAHPEANAAELARDFGVDEKGE